MIPMQAEFNPVLTRQRRVWNRSMAHLLLLLAMSVAGTAIAGLLSIPPGILAARNTSPHPAAYRAARAAGCSPLQVTFHGIVPQVLPQMADTAIYRWEYNFRASTVMGMVGAGGSILVIG